MHLCERLANVNEYTHFFFFFLINASQPGALGWTNTLESYFTHNKHIYKVSKQVPGLFFG